MMKVFRNKKIIALVALFFMGYCAENALYQHTHRLGNNLTVSHSHPYSGNASQPGHTHSSIAFATISQLNKILALIVAALTLCAISAKPNLLIKETTESKYSAVPDVYFSLRAPPAVR